jgi:hypothetical protein
MQRQEKMRGVLAKRTESHRDNEARKKYKKEKGVKE